MSVMELRPPESGQLTAKAKDGQTITYTYCCEKESHPTEGEGEPKTKWCFYIQIDQDIFEFHLVDEGSFMRVEMMNNNGCEQYKARGIPEAFIRLSHDVFETPICSSKPSIIKRNSKGIERVDQQRSPEAEKVWERLVASKEAYYDESSLHFVYTGKGDCYKSSYENAATFQQLKEDVEEDRASDETSLGYYKQLRLSSDIFIIHGWLTDEDRRKHHAWVEIGKLVIETQCDQQEQYTRDAYYEHYKPVTIDWKYTVAEANEMIKKHGVYGNWAAKESAEERINPNLG